jgi:hypothetical protein
MDDELDATLTPEMSMAFTYYHSQEKIGKETEAR